jgi:hypothetical protein
VGRLGGVDILALPRERYVHTKSYCTTLSYITVLEQLPEVFSVNRLVLLGVYCLHLRKGIVFEDRRTDSRRTSVVVSASFIRYVPLWMMVFGSSLCLSHLFLPREKGWMGGWCWDVRASGGRGMGWDGWRLEGIGIVLV